ncbi:iron-sulfur cluster biosynthesis family protein [Niallia endozanthoxylica]|uniref:Iron-sulfur cluster biosynthesis family protein n=1 Tax=Niallia endozanthoxylica TaxID=2036016 RepID=A0A5J5HYT5_9BACI|nr:iron-sulfur cluster biosynthesis family protein [Niallia endozanthoxylica]KAA9026202.1 iron-sulfur cluster biosynthesis family protein [Niallia endozanthoxylica]
MEIKITDRAAEKISEFRTEKQGLLKLKYDTEECGCVMCGVTNLWLVNQLEDDDYAVETNHDTIYVEKSKELFLDDILTIDFHDGTNCFQLKSPNQYLNPRMSIFDKRE